MFPELTRRNKMHPSVAAFIFLTIVATVLGSDHAQYKSNCFYQDAKDSCRSKTVSIDGKLYGCEDFIDFENEIIKIEFLGDLTQQTVHPVLVQDSEHTSYEINENTKKRSTKPSNDNCKLVVDEKENTFKIESGETSVTGRNGRKRNITTESEFISKELALDSETGTLIILASKNNNRGETVIGSLFAININKLSNDPVIQARKITTGEVIFTGLSIYSGLNDLLVGIKTDGQYKYVKLSAVPNDNPCFNKPKTTLQEQILEILEETNWEESQRISKLCSEYSQTTDQENNLSANQLTSRISEGGEENTTGCVDKLERQRKLLEKIKTTIKPITTVRKDLPDYQKNLKVYNEFFYEVHEILLK